MSIHKEKNYRNNGAIGALLDEYERAINDLKGILNLISNHELLAIVDSETTDEDCRSVQTILTHVVRSGYGYAIYVRQKQGEQLPFIERELLTDTNSYEMALEKMFAYSVQLFTDYPNLKIEEFEEEKKIAVSWGQLYDIEQIFEHAIVHILRHRRQIERFLLRLRARE